MTNCTSYFKWNRFFFSHKLFPAHFKVFQSFCVILYCVLLYCYPYAFHCFADLLNLFFFWMLFSFLFALLCTLLINHYEITETKHINILEIKKNKRRKRNTSVKRWELGWLEMGSGKIANNDQRLKRMRMELCCWCCVIHKMIVPIHFS